MGEPWMPAVAVKGTLLYSIDQSITEDMESILLDDDKLTEMDGGG